ncbi:MAG: PrgI family protein [Patescibacteria group bacterium]
MQFQVPQFIDIENKIVGPLSLRQFLYVAAAGGLSFLLFFLDIFKLWSWVMLSAVLVGLGAALAFGKYNGQPFPKIALRAFSFFVRPRLYLWRREIEEITIDVPEIKIPEILQKPLEKEAKKSTVKFPAMKHLEIPAENVVIKRKSLKEYFPDMPSVKNLMLNLMTTKSPIPKREKPHLLNWGQVPKEKFEILKRITGEKEMARRVDYK